MSVTVHIARSTPKAVESVGVPVGVKGARAAQPRPQPRCADRGGLRRQARTDIGRAVGHRPDADRGRDRRRETDGCGFAQRRGSAGSRRGQARLDRDEPRRPRWRRLGNRCAGGRRGCLARRVPLPRPEDRAGARGIAGTDTGRWRAAALREPGSAPTEVRSPRPRRAWPEISPTRRRHISRRG